MTQRYLRVNHFWRSQNVSVSIHTGVEEKKQIGKKRLYSYIKK